MKTLRIYDFGFGIWNGSLSPCLLVSLSLAALRTTCHSLIPKSQLAHSLSPRRGVTLMEVLISAGITAVGLFGVLALIPVAGIQVQRGMTEDRKAVLGKNAISEFHARGFRRPEMWIFADGNPVWNPANYPNSPFPPAATAFCFDPQFVIQNGTANNASFNAAVFPYPVAAANNNLAMFRLSLRAAQGWPLAGLMNAQLAEEIFMAQDDLEFTIPGGNQRTEPAFQNFTSGNTKRQSAGQYSWFATLVPKLGGMSDEEYVLSVVVLKKRDPTFQPNDITTVTAAKDVNERVFNVTAFNSAGTGGGEIQITAINSPAEVEGIFQNDWIMLASQPRDQFNNPMPPDFKWYRIIGIDDPVGNTRRLTLQGADWPWGGGTQATIVSGVVGVFERTVRLETTGLWTQ